MGGLWCAARMHSKLGLCMIVTCPHALGRRQCRVQERCPGATRRKRRRDAWARSKSMRLRARYWLVAVASNNAALLRLVVQYSWSAHTCALRHISPFLPVRYCMYCTCSLKKSPICSPLSSTSESRSPPSLHSARPPAETLAPLPVASLRRRHS